MQPSPPPEVQARALLDWLHARHAGHGLPAGYVKDECYPAMLEAKGWRRQPWDGRHGIGKHLTRLTGGTRRSGYVQEADGSKRRVRGYFIPLVIEVRKRA